MFVAALQMSAGPANGSAATVDDAITLIRNVHIAHADLPALLESDAALRKEYVGAHLTLSKAAYDPRTGNGDKAKIRNFHHDLLDGSSGIPGREWFRTGPSFPKSRSTIAFLRDRALRTYKDVLGSELDRFEYVRVTGLDPARANLFRQYNLILLDNSGLSARQVEVISTLLALIPKTLHDTQAIGAVGLHGPFPAEIGWWDFFGGHGGEINIFEVSPGSAGGNPFPVDVPPSRDDLFFSALAHELNHIVDAYAVYRNPSLRATEQALIAEAGCEPLNYLRSILPPCFFRDAPQEFFASIGNIWFIDTSKTFDLALARFDQGRRSPLYQALFFLDVYSMGTNKSSFYGSNANADVARTDVDLERDSAGRITSITLGGRRWRFFRDSAGEVVSYHVGNPRRRASRK